MQLLDSAKLDLNATAYAEDIKKGIHDFGSIHADVLDQNLGHQHIVDLNVCVYENNIATISFNTYKFKRFPCILILNQTYLFLACRKQIHQNCKRISFPSISSTCP